MAKDAGKSVQDVPAEVRRLLAAGKSKQAVELAKEEHKRHGSADSERLLVDAYLARIQQFQDKGAAEDARTLLNLVRERFPAHADRLTHLSLRTAAVGGDVSTLVTPLARPDVPDDLRDSIETAVRQQIVNLSDLANTPALPAEHPLRQAAAAVWKAYLAVTSGPVTDEQIALPEVSRRSPLASWKMLIRAIAAFYRHDDDGCRRALEGIADDSAAAKLKPVLTAMLDGRAAETGYVGALQSRVGGNDQALRQAIERVEAAMADPRERGLRGAANDAIAACAKVRPEVTERLRQHILAKSALSGTQSEALTDIFFDARKTASFWRLWALSHEQCGRSSQAAFYWWCFIRHALHEKLIQPRSPEEAAARLHLAQLVARIDPRTLQADERYLRNSTMQLKAYYHNQPPEIAALKPGSNAQILAEIYNAGQLFERAVELDPDIDAFRQWWAWGLQHNLANRDQEHIAVVWNRLRTGDPEPLLHLSALAESRNALKLALKHLSEAEAIDALNPAVRKARLRLTLATAWRHFRDKRPHLVEQDIAELETLPAMQEGDRPAVLGALRVALHALRLEKNAAQQAADSLVASSGPLVADVVVDAVGRAAKVWGNAAWPNMPGVVLPDPRAVAEAEARTIRLTEDLRFATYRPVAWDAMITQVLAQTPCPLSHGDLLAIGDAAVTRRDNAMAYLASTAGLASANGPAAARFLVLRADALPYYANRRARQCLRAAAELAQQAHDPDLMAKVSDSLERRNYYYHGTGRPQPLGEELLAEVMKQERAARAFPANADEADRPVVAIDPEPQSGPFGGFDDFGDEDEYDEEEGYEEYDEDYDYEDEDDEDDDLLPRPPATSEQDFLEMIESLPPDMMREMMKQLKLPKGLPPAALPVLLKIVAKFGRVPGPDELFKLDPKLAAEFAAIVGFLDLDVPDEGPQYGFGGGRGKKRRKRRR